MKDKSLHRSIWLEGPRPIPLPKQAMNITSKDDDEVGPPSNLHLHPLRVGVADKKVVKGLPLDATKTARVFLQLSRQQRNLLAILHPLETFLQFPTLQGRFCTFPRKLGYFCNFLRFKGFSAIFHKLGNSMQLLRAAGVLLQFFTFPGVFCNFYIFRGFSAIFPSRRAFVTFPTNRDFCAIFRTVGTRDISVIFPLRWDISAILDSRGSFLQFLHFLGGYICNYSHPKGPREMRGTKGQGAKRERVKKAPPKRGSKDPKGAKEELPPPRRGREGPRPPPPNTPPSFYRGEGGEEEGDRRWGHTNRGANQRYPPPVWKEVGGLPNRRYLQLETVVSPDQLAKYENSRKSSGSLRDRGIVRDDDGAKGRRRRRKQEEARKHESWRSKDFWEA
ncbi:hypothetical protein Taro_025604 [Colocasia esculenta]|uniref:Uncharacterized protein n=1 Tax=Colocasia esculenta TaxID=4460 RepID=A0A843VNT2_COLES|nr:hypothetical protein [Colocasia esculenta]